MCIIPRRYNWPLTPGHRGIDEGLEIKLEGCIQWTDESSEEALGNQSVWRKEERTDVERKGRCCEEERGMYGVAFNQSFPFLLPSLFHLSLLSFLFFFFLSHSILLRCRFSVAMATVPATAEEDRIPEERKRMQRRSKPRWIETKRMNVFA